MYVRETCARRRRLGAAGALLLAGVMLACSSPAAAPATKPPPVASPGAVAPALATAGTAPTGGASSPARAEPAAPPAPIKVTMAPPSPGVIFLVYYLGQAKGLYAAEGVDLDLSIIPANTAIAAMLAGELDFTASAGSAARAAAQGTPVRVVMGLIDQSLIDLHASREIGSVADLRGKSIAITSIVGTPAQVGRLIVQSTGMTEGDVSYVQTQTTPNAFAALAAGGVPAALLDPPFTAMAESQGYRAIARGKDYIRSTQAGIAATEQRIAEQPDKIARTIRGTLRSIAYTLDNESEAVDYIMKTWELDQEAARLTYRTIAEGIVRDGNTAPDIMVGELHLAGLDATAEQVMDFGILRRVLQEPAWRDVCAAGAAGRPKGCR
jgi:ABC-type nitrate/sulfonate/bicarbonate transport system substrate-binding protein